MDTGSDTRLMASVCAGGVGRDGTAELPTPKRITSTELAIKIANFSTFHLQKKFCYQCQPLTALYKYYLTKNLFCQSLVMHKRVLS